jgi:hypothetical protein
MEAKASRVEAVRLRPDGSTIQRCDFLAPNWLLQLQGGVVQLDAIKFLILPGDIRPRPQMQFDPVARPPPRR